MRHKRKVNQIYSQLQTGGKEGMNTIDQCLAELINKNEITLEEGLSKTNNQEAVKQLLKNI